MRYALAALCLAAFAMTTPAAAQTPAPAPAAPEGPITTVTYLEFADDFANRGGALVMDYRGKNIRASGNSNIETFVEIGQPHRYAVVELWQNAAAQDGHAKATGGAPKLDVKQGALAPADVRLHKRWNSAGSMAPTSQSVFVLTHVDVPPPRQAEVEAIMKALAEKSRAEAGFARFDIVQSTTRPNHFTFIEAWENAAAAQAHATAPHTLEFRTKLNPILGALYDERRYKFLQ